MAPISIGRTVHLKLGEHHVRELEERRNAGERMNTHEVGQVVPMVVTKLWGPPSPEVAVQGSAMIDGQGTLWATSVTEGDQPGQWSWPPKA